MASSNIFITVSASALKAQLWVPHKNATGFIFYLYLKLVVAMAESVKRRSAIERRESTKRIVRKKEAKIAAAGGGKTVKREWSMVSTAAG